MPPRGKPCPTEDERSAGSRSLPAQPSLRSFRAQRRALPVAAACRAITWPRRPCGRRWRCSVRAQRRPVGATTFAVRRASSIEPYWTVSCPPTAPTVKKCATRSTCGRPPGWVTCCRTTATGRTTCKVKSSPAKCTAPSGGQSCSSGYPSCCDACTTSGCASTPTPAPPTVTSTPTITPTPTITDTPTVPAVCQAQVAVTPLAQVPIALAPGSNQCGGLQLRNPPAAPPLSGSVADGNGDNIGDLGLGCLYTGSLPPLMLPSGATSKLDVVGFSLLPSLSLALAGSAGDGPTNCTRGAGPGRKCANGAPGLDNMGTCNFDSDCGANKPTACALEPNCYFGPPIPVPLGALSACVVNTFQTDLCGQIDLATQTSTFATVLASRVYLTFDADSPCPRCEGGQCNSGDNAGLPCAPLGSAQTSIDCPPSAGTFVGVLSVVIPNLTSAVANLAASDGMFCDGQSSPGAFGLMNAHSVTESGTAPSLVGLTTLQTNLGGTFCIAPSGAEVLDVIAGLPTVGALGVSGNIDLTTLLAP